MLTYTPPEEQDLPPATERPWLLLLLCLAWLLPGLLGREPLKPEETIFADIIQTIVHGGSLIVPSLAGEAWLEHGPLMYWLGAAMAKLGSILGLPLHAGARLATGCLMALALWATGLTARELIGRRHGRSAVLILIGCAGLLLPGHALNADIAVLAGWCWGIYALAIAPRASVLAGVLLGASIAFCGLSASLAEAALLGMLALLIGLAPTWRKRRYAVTLIFAASLALPLLAAWPIALKQANPFAFARWWDFYSLGFFGGFTHLRAFHPFGFYLQLLPWFAWPAWFLAGATLWMQRDRLQQARFQLPLLAAGLSLICLFLSNSGRAGYALLLLPPLALIGAVGLDVLRRGASAFVNWLGVMLFGLLGLIMWLGWSAMHFGSPARLSARIQALSPGFVPEFSISLSILAILMSIAWLWAISRKRPMGRQAVTNWAVGVSLCWMLATTFASSWVDTRSAYKDLANAMAKQLPPTGCIASENLQASPRAALHYYIGLQTIRREQQAMNSCHWLLRQSGREALSPPPGWQQIWQGSRAGDRSEQYTLYRQD